ncbi:MAG TPA: helix-turn-helix domain-containing protein [Syntrophomonadaceae bacterium]|nr:helix-turn-helix domain-containing protein [Syntrophomonadaceae bacterium]
MKMQKLDINIPDSWPFVLRPQDVMQITGIGKNKILDLLQSGEIPAKRVRGRWLISRDSLLNWLSN